MIGAKPLSPAANNGHQTDVVDILAGIDGTDSLKWMLHEGANSHVYRFCADFRTDATLKDHFHGPTLKGDNVRSIAEEVHQFITSGLAKHPQARVSLLGHSRGGLIAIMVARRLKVPIHFLGLYDAVDRYIGESGRVIPGNVRAAYHAVRRFWSLSRVYFGHTGQSCEPGVLYREEPFLATHGGVGGDPLGPANWAHSLFLTMPEDRAESQRAGAWMRDMAREEKLPIG